MSYGGGPIDVGGWRLSKTGDIWRAVDPSTGKVKFSDTDKGVVYTWAMNNPKK